MLRVAYTPPPVPPPYAASLVLPPVPGVGSHSYTRVPTELLGPNQCPVPPYSAGHPPAVGVAEAKLKKLDVSVAYCTPEAAAWAAAQEAATPADSSYVRGKYYSSPSKPAKFYPHGAPLEPVGDEDGIGARLLAEMHARLEELRATDPTRDLDKPQDNKPKIHAIVLGRYIPRGEREEEAPLAYGEMYQRPAGYVPGPPGYGYENYMRDPPPAVPPEHTHFPDGPLGVPMSHGHPSFLGRTWRDAAPPLIQREPSTALSGRGRPAAPQPKPGEPLLNPHSTVAEREYNARVVFRRFDTDNDGMLNLDDFVRAMNYLGAAVTHDDADTIFAMFDDDHSGTMDEEEFVQNFLNSYS